MTLDRTPASAAPAPSVRPASGRGAEDPGQGSRAPRRRRRGISLTRLDRKVSPYLLIAPFFVVFAVFGLFPLLYTGWVSLHEWNLIAGGDHPFIGLGNYIKLFQDPYFWNALVNTFGIFIIATIPQLLMALAIAEVLNRRLRARSFFRMGILLPFVSSVAAVAVVFKQLFGEKYGLINYVIGLVGIDPIMWQTNRLASWVAIATMVDWRWTGYMALIYLAAMQAIPRVLYEAAEIDGASPWRRFWTITVPMLRPTLIFTVVIATIGGMLLVVEPMLFGSNPAAATGGASRQFQTLQLLLYETGFKDFEFGYSAAIGWVLFFIVIVVALLNYLLTRNVRDTSQ